MNNLVSLRTMITLLAFIGPYKKNIHLLIITTFLDSGTVHKCEGGFYNAAQILADKNINMDYPIIFYISYFKNTKYYSDYKLL
jgi:hypothetical protein